MERTRRTTFVFDVPSVKRSDAQKVQAVRDLFADALAQRNAALSEAAVSITRSLKATVEGHNREQVRSARWYRTCSQLDILEPLAAEVRTMTDNPALPLAGRLEGVIMLLEQKLQRRMVTLCNEAQTIANDMEALTMRVQQDGHLAEIRDFRSARWYCTVAQMEALKLLYTAVHQIVGRPSAAVPLPVVDQDSGGLGDGVVDSPIDDV